MLLAAAPQLLNIRIFRQQYIALHGLIHDLTQVANAVTQLLSKSADTDDQMPNATQSTVAAAAAAAVLSVPQAPAVALAPVQPVMQVKPTLPFCLLHTESAYQ
jgi:hypothetical protein